MKNLFSLLILFTFLTAINAQTLKPYILGAVLNGSIESAKESVKKGIDGTELKIVGEYMPAEDNSRYVIVVSHPALDNAVKKTGGLTGFAATLRIGITSEDGVINISYTNPFYWGNAYFRNDFPQVADDYAKVERCFKKAFQGLGKTEETPFGSKKGLKISNLRKYHYMFGMPYFDVSLLRSTSCQILISPVILRA